MPQQGSGSLYNSMGGSSPMFLTSTPSAGLDTSPLGYFVQQRERAQQSLAAKIAADTPKLPEFDDKTEALAGDKQYLYNQILERRGKIAEGLKKYGGIPTSYVNSEEGKRDLNALNNDVYNYRVAKNNFTNKQLAEKKVLEKNLGGQIYMDPKTEKPVSMDGKTFATYDDYLQHHEENPYEKSAGVLANKDFQIMETGSDVVNKEINELGKSAGETDWSTEQPNLEWDPQTGAYKPGKLVGEYMYNVLQTTTQGGHGNKEQLNSAANTLFQNLSKPARISLKQELYEMQSGMRNPVGVTDFSQYDEKTKSYKKDSVDWKKFNSDDAYAQDVYNGYMYDRIHKQLAPFKKSGSVSKTTLDSLGRVEGGGSQDKAGYGYTENFIRGNLPVDTKTVTTYVDDGTGKMVAMDMLQQKPKQSFASTQEFQSLNNILQKGAVTLNGVNAIIYGHNVNNLNADKTGVNKSALKNAKIVSVDDLITDKPMVYDERTGGYRNPTKQELQAGQESIHKQELGTPLTAQDLKNIKDFSPKAYYKSKIDLGSDYTLFGGSHDPKWDQLHGVNVNTGESNLSAVDEGAFGGDTNQGEGYGVYLDPTTNNYYATVLIPVGDVDGVIGSDKEAYNYLNNSRMTDQKTIDYQSQQQQQQNQGYQYVKGVSK